MKVYSTQDSPAKILLKPTKKQVPIKESNPERCYYFLSKGIQEVHPVNTNVFICDFTFFIFSQPQKQPLADVCLCRCSKKFSKINLETLVSDSVFNKVSRTLKFQNPNQETLTKMFHCEFFKNTFKSKRLRRPPWRRSDELLKNSKRQKCFRIT